MMTPEQAAAKATVWSRFMRTPFAQLVASYGHPGIEPTTAQRQLMLPPRPGMKDPVHVRLRRLERYPKLHAIASTYTRRAHGEVHPFLVLGAVPKDYIGQCSLVYHLSASFAYWDVASAFSVPFSGLAERLLIGEQLNDEVDRVVASIINEVT